MKLKSLLITSGTLAGINIIGLIVLSVWLLFGLAGCASGNGGTGLWELPTATVTKCDSVINPMSVSALLGRCSPGEWEEIPSWPNCEPIFSIGQPWGNWLPEGLCPSPNGPQIIYEYTIPGDSIPCVIFAWNIKLKRPGRAWLLKTEWP